MTGKAAEVPIALERRVPIAGGGSRFGKIRPAAGAVGIRPRLPIRGSIDSGRQPYLIIRKHPMSEQPTVADYIVRRLACEGIADCFGVAGDFASINDAVARSEAIRWIGCSNELDAAYAGDGYARVWGCSMLLITYAVSELPAALGCGGRFTAKVTTLGELDAALARAATVEPACCIAVVAARLMEIVHPCALN
jgi:hypothetical protein